MCDCRGGGHKLLTCVTKQNGEDNREQRKVGGITMRSCRRKNCSKKTKANGNMKHKVMCGKLIKHAHKVRRDKTHRSEDCPTVCAEATLQTDTTTSCPPVRAGVSFYAIFFLRDFALMRLEN
jgi:hypothetical protein